MNQALAKYAKALCDSLFVSEWDGFDIDWEPGAGFSDSDGTLNNTTIQVLVKEMANILVRKVTQKAKDTSYYVSMVISTIFLKKWKNM